MLDLNEYVISSIEKSNDSGLPLIICLIATKACYIKFATVVHALANNGYPFISIESGQHYEKQLTNAPDELEYREHIHGSFCIRGDLTQKSSTLITALFKLNEELKTMGLSKEPILAICGDTLSAGIAPVAWYLGTANRSIHVEAGLRSLRPRWEWSQDYLDHRILPWESDPTRPFPEGLCTRIATCASQQLMAPVQRNVDNLLRENYNPDSIFLSGSPSVDAVELAKKRCVPDSGKRLRVDIHRRENLTRERLSIIFCGLAKLACNGIPVEFVISKTMQSCEGTSWDYKDIKTLETCGVTTSLQWDSYLRVISFLLSPDCIGVYTDSGGLQEETCILGVPCMTCRFETDRPETVIDFKTNVLVPPISSDYICSSILQCFSNPADAWPPIADSLDTSHCYGTDVGKAIVGRLRSINFEVPTSHIVK